MPLFFPLPLVLSTSVLQMIYTIFHRPTPMKRKPRVSNNEKRRLAKQKSEEEQNKLIESPPAETSPTKAVWSGWYTLIRFILCFIFGGGGGRGTATLILLFLVMSFLTLKIQSRQLYSHLAETYMYDIFPANHVWCSTCRLAWQLAFLRCI